MSMKLTREIDLAAEWDLTHQQMRTLRLRNGWAHVRFSRQDVRYTDAQIEQITRDMTAGGAKRKPAEKSGQTQRSAARSA